MARVKTFSNGGTLVPTDLNSIEDDYEYAFSTYKSVPTLESPQPGAIAASTTAATYIWGYQGIYAQGSAASIYLGGFYLDPAEVTAGTRANKLRLRAQCATNSVAPTVNFTFGLYPISAFGGGSNQVPYINTLGTVVSGSTIAFNTPSASTQTDSNSGDFTWPAAGWYSFGVVVSGTVAANSIPSFLVKLQYRQV